MEQQTAAESQRADGTDASACASAQHAVQVALDRRDNGGDAGAARA